MAEQNNFSAELMIGLMDLTSLSGSETAADIEALCAKAVSAPAMPAALCIYKQHLPAADAGLRARGVRGDIALATVANFPHGGEDAQAASAEVAEAVFLGADEVDIVIPYQAVAENRMTEAAALVRACRKAAAGKLLKVILESGALLPAMIKAAAELAIAEGADFIKTSTGKSAVHATPEAARIMLEVIQAKNPHCGFKASGGLKTKAQAESYLQLAAEICGADWISKRHFRFGASGLLDALAGAAAAQAEY